MDGTRNRLQEYFEELRRRRIDRDDAKRDRKVAHYRIGLSLGGRWAFSVATLDELDCLEIFQARLATLGEWESWFTARSTGPAFARFHFAVVDPRGANLPGRLPVNPKLFEAIRFWRSTGATFEERRSGDFIQGFADGALETWRRFKAKNVEPS